MLALVSQCAVRGLAPPHPVGFCTLPLFTSTAAAYATRERNRGIIQITSRMKNGQATKSDAVAGVAALVQAFNWDHRLNLFLPVLALASIMNPILTSVAIVSFVVGRATYEGKVEVESDRSEQLCGDLENLRLRVMHLESANQDITSCSSSADTRIASRMSLQVVSAPVCEEGGGNPHSGMEDPRYNSRMRERILFLWGEQGLQWFGLDKDIYRAQHALSDDSEAFLQRNKGFLEILLDNSDHEK